MEFFKCSIAGVSYGTGVTEIERVAAARKSHVLPPSAPHPHIVASCLDACMNMQHGSSRVPRHLSGRLSWGQFLLGTGPCASFL